MCEYSIVLHAALISCNLKSLILLLITSDVETREFDAHCVIVECYLDSFKKWSFLIPSLTIGLRKRIAVKCQVIEARHFDVYLR